MTSSVELSIYIESLRQEIQKEIELGKDKDLRFFSDKIELEVEAAVTTQVSAKGEVALRFLVFDFTGGPAAERSTGATQTIKLTLTPAYKNEKGIWISGGGTKMAF